MADRPLTERLKVFGIELGNPTSLTKYEPYWREMAVRELQGYLLAADKVASNEMDGDAPALDRRSAKPKPTLTLPLPHEPKRGFDGATGDATVAPDNNTDAILSEALESGLTCPVVLQSFTYLRESAVARGTRLNKNLWNVRDEQHKAHVFAVDLSGTFYPRANYDDPAYEHRDWLDGRRNNEPKGRIRIGYELDDHLGKPNSWPSTDTKVLLTTDIANVVNDQNAVYRVVRTAARFESHGYLDCINAWDDSFFTLGLFQWAIGADGGECELGALLARFKRADPDTYRRYFGAWGIHPAKVDPPLSVGRPLCEIVRRTGIDQVEPFDKHQREYFRTWHWVFRAQAAVRNSFALQRAMYKLAAERATGLVKLPVPGLPQRVLADYFKSQRGVAMLTRWHIKSPGTLTGSLRDLINLSGLSGDPTTFTDDDEDTLCSTLIQMSRLVATCGLGDDLESICKMPPGELDRTRGSFPD